MIKRVREGAIHATVVETPVAVSDVTSACKALEKVRFSPNSLALDNDDAGSPPLLQKHLPRRLAHQHTRPCV